MAATSTTPDDAWSIPVYEQTLAIEGDHVDVSIAPVYNGKSWAFTARWDDNSPNNLNMRDAMAELGLKPQMPDLPAVSDRRHGGFKQPSGYLRVQSEYPR
ncbi:MAG: hypothetical protein ACQKBV_09755 [Puniceicoccales bacterium]